MNTKENWMALFLAITQNKTAEEALAIMGVKVSRK